MSRSIKPRTPLHSPQCLQRRETALGRTPQGKPVVRFADNSEVRFQVERLRYYSLNLLTPSASPPNKLSVRLWKKTLFHIFVFQSPLPPCSEESVWVMLEMAGLLLPTLEGGPGLCGRRDLQEKHRGCGDRTQVLELCAPAT